MRPMSLLESGDSSGAVSLSALFSGARLTPVPAPQSDLAHIAFLCCRGGWPTSTFLPPELALRPAVEYYNAVVNVDINQVGGVSRSTERAKKLMRSYARFQGTQTPLSQIVADMNGPDAAGSSEKTVASYLDALAAMFVIEEMPAWNPNLKSRTAIRTAPTRYFVDPSIAAASLGIGPRDLMNDLKAFGLIFETLCARDLRVYSQPLDGEICHFRNKNGLECDAVVHLPNGSFGLVEVKLGGERLVNEGAENLLKLASKIDTGRMKAPSFLMVLTATGALAYQRPDGVLVVPVSTLGA